MGILDKITAGLDPTSANYAANQGLLGMASGLLQASGPSPRPINLGQAFGQGLQGFNQAAAQAKQQQLAAEKEARLKSQQDAMNQLMSGAGGLPLGWKMTPQGLTYDPAAAQAANIAQAKGVYEGYLSPTNVPVPMSAGGGTGTGSMASVVGSKPSGVNLAIKPKPEARSQYAGPRVNLSGMSPKQRQEYTYKIETEKPKAYASYANLDENLKTMEDAATALENHPGIDWATGKTYLTGAVPGTEAYNFATDLETLKSKIMLNTMQSMRALSKNGSSGFGQLSNAEGEVLKNNIAALQRARTKPAVLASLKKIVEFTKRLRKNTRNAYEMTYGALPEQPAQPQPIGGDGWSATVKQ